MSGTPAFSGRTKKNIKIWYEFKDLKKNVRKQTCDGMLQNDASGMKNKSVKDQPSHKHLQRKQSNIREFSSKSITPRATARPPTFCRFSHALPTRPLRRNLYALTRRASRNYAHRSTRRNRNESYSRDARLHISDYRD